MQTVVDVMQGPNTVTYIVSWRGGVPPEDNEELNQELEELPDCMVPASFGSVGYRISLIDGIDPETVADIFRSYRYRVTRVLSAV